MDASEILNIIFGAGLIGSVVAIATLRSTVRKAKAEAVKAEADAETVRVDNAEHATRILIDNIVKPLKDELNATRKDLQATKREMARLRKSIDNANGCKHRDECPVLYGLRDDQAYRDPDGDGIEQTRGRQRGRNGSRGVKAGNRADGAGASGGEETAPNLGTGVGIGSENGAEDTEPP